jgi:hypothetical protein
MAVKAAESDGAAHFGQMQVQKLIFADIRKRLVPTGGIKGAVVD